MQLADRLKALPTETGRLSVTPVSPALGAEISGVDVSEPLPAASIQAIRDALRRPTAWSSFATSS